MHPIKNIGQLTSLRFFAAASIVLHHSKEFFSATRGIDSPIPLDFAVSFFFVLSGFILAYNYRHLEGRDQILGFYVARFSRIWPVHLFSFAMVVIMLPSGVWTPPFALEQALSVTVFNVLLLHAWVPMKGYFFSFNAVSWSISTELFFYLIFPLIICKWRRMAYPMTAIIFGVAFGLVTLAKLLSLPALSDQNPLEISREGVAYISPFVRVVEFLIGIWVAKVFVRVDTARWGNKWAWTILEALALALVYVVGKISLQVIKAEPHPNAWQIYVGASGGAFAFAFVVFVMAADGGLLSRILSAKPLVVLGQASFALYMTHQIVLTFITLNQAPYLMKIPNDVQCLLFWGGCIVLSIAVHRYVEQPARRRLTNVLLPGAKSSRILSRRPD
jgi:peptidoglycan/LPS O-acetylase OafA/YrhL